MNVLIIDDCADDMQATMEIWKDWANLHSFEWKFVTSGLKGIDLLQCEEIGLVLMDGHLIGEYGHEVIEKIRQEGITVPICMFSSDLEQNQAGEQAGAEFSINKKKFMDEYLSMYNKDAVFEEMDHLAAIMQLTLLRTG